MTPKEFIERWIEGIKKITPEQQLQSKLACHIGGSIGLSLATFFIFLRGMWHFGIFLIFMVGLQLIGAIGTFQQLDKMKEYQGIMAEQKEQLKKILEESE